MYRKQRPAFVGVRSVLCIMFALVSGTPAYALTSIRQADVPFFTSSVPGETEFVVAENLTGAPGQTVITIDTSNVRLDLNRRTLTGPGEESGVGVHATTGSETILGGTITAFRRGIHVGRNINEFLPRTSPGLQGGAPPRGTWIERVTLTHNRFGINEFLAVRTRIFRCTISENRTGILSEDVNGTEVLFNTLARNTVSGFEAGNAGIGRVVSNHVVGNGVGIGIVGEFETVRNNRISNNDTAIFVGRSSSGAPIERNQFLFNENGVVLFDVARVVVRRNLIARNGAGIEVGTNLEVREVRIEENRILSNDTFGIHLGFITFRAIVRRNTISGNGTDGIRVAGGDENLLEVNTVTRNGGIGIVLQNESELNRIQNNRVLGNGRGQNRIDVADFNPVNGVCENIWTDNRFRTKAGDVECIH